MREELPALRSPMVTCAAKGCEVRALAVPLLGDEGETIPGAPAGWGEIVAISDQGDELVLFVCSPACERRLARKLTEPRQGMLG